MSHHNRLGINRTFLLVVLQGTAVLLFCTWYTHQSPHSSAPPKGKVHVLLLSSWRSGSSLLGQVFSQHPSAFYLMEPGWHVWTALQKPGARVLRMAVRDLLRSLYQCDFSVMGSYLPENHRVSSLFMWAESRALCSPPACSLTPRGQMSNMIQCNKTCDSQGLKKVQRACRTYSHVVYKETRLFELESLYPLLEDPKLNLRIVHLVRDPRAVLRSREAAPRAIMKDSAIVLEQRNISRAQVQYKVMQEVCRSHVSINERAILNPPPFLKGRYKMIRYEDLVLNPLKEINNIYKFVGLEMTRQMEQWIHQVTHGKGKGTRKEAFQIISRNATQVSQAWRTTLPHYKVRRVQDVCKEAMALLGYKIVYSEKVQKRLTVDLLVPREPYQFGWAPTVTQ